MPGTSKFFIQERASRPMAARLRPQAKGMGPTKLAMLMKRGRLSSMRPEPSITLRPRRRPPQKMHRPRSATAAPR